MSNAYHRFTEKLFGGGSSLDRATERLDLVSNAAPTGQGSGSREIDARSNGHQTSINIASSSGESRKAPAKRGFLGLLQNAGNPHKGIERFGLSIYTTIKHYVINDLFTTLLNAPGHRFLLVFFVVYMSVFFFFALLYIAQPSECINEPNRNFAHVFWFSFQTASTIGYAGDMYPNPDCAGLNFLVMINIICASLLDYCLMGVVFARFAAPLPKALAIRFSANAVLYRLEGRGLWCLSFRLANIRKHSLLKPEICLLLAVPDQDGASLRFKELEVEDMATQLANLRLGLPAIVSHVVTPSSPLFEMSLEEMGASGIELLCFLDGMDPMTSNSLQARHSYRSQDIKMNERFTSIELSANKRGQMGLDFSGFDRTVAADVLPTDDEHDLPSPTLLYPVPPASSTLYGPGGQRRSDAPPGALHDSDAAALREHMNLLRSQTLRSITSAGALAALTHVPAAPASRHTGSGGGRAPLTLSLDLPGLDSDPQGLDPLGAMPRPKFSAGAVQQQLPALLSLLSSLLEDGSTHPDLKRKAALARAELLAVTLPSSGGAGLPQQQPGEVEVGGINVQLPVSVGASTSSGGVVHLGAQGGVGAHPGPLGRHDLLYPH